MDTPVDRPNEVSLEQLEATDLSASTDDALAAIHHRATVFCWSVASGNLPATNGRMKAGTPYARWSDVGRRALQVLRERGYNAVDVIEGRAP